MRAMHVIHLFTDFGVAGPYLGQMQAVLLRSAPQIPVVNLMADAPAFDPFHSAYLLHAYAHGLPSGDIVLGVIDPGVGSERAGVALLADGVWYVGPDNGLFEIVAMRAHACDWWSLPPPESPIAASFHGRDWFAPCAARLAAGQWRPSLPGRRLPPSGGHGLPDTCPEFIYIDRYGNGVTGLPGHTLSPGSVLSVNGRCLRWANTFSAVAEGEPFWYVNANGLAEVAANRARAADVLGLQIGAVVAVSV